MHELARFGVSMDEGLLQQFDELIKTKGYANRSQAIADLVRGALVEQEWEAGSGPTVGTVSMVYDHHSHDVGHKLTHIQHDHLANIVSTLHVHLDAKNCLEVLVLRGTAAEIKSLGDKLISSKGVKHGKLMMTTEGRTF
jgi:CopG family nickel-responsive transcriptional regulator